MLVNNVGIREINYFDKQEEKIIKDHIMINCLVAMRLTSHLSKKMLKRKKRSGIVNVSCTDCHFTPPYSGLYSATKALIDQFSQVLSREMRNENIDVLCLRPHNVTSRMNYFMKDLGLIPPEYCIMSAW